MEKEVFIEGIGMVTFRQSPKARHYSLKISKGKVLAVMPVGGNEALMRRFINENRARIETALVKHPERLPLDETTDLRATTFRVRICRSERKDFRMRLQDEVLSVECPSETCFSDTKVQELLRSMIERALRHEAKRLLPDRLSGLAMRHGFRFSEVKINNSKTHWGSCTTRRQQQQDALGQLYHASEHQPLPVVDAPALALGRLCSVARVVPYGRDEPQRPLLGLDGQGDRRTGVSASTGVERVSYVGVSFRLLFLFSFMAFKLYFQLFYSLRQLFFTRQ